MGNLDKFMNQNPSIQAVVGVIYNPQQQVLIALRPANKSLAGFWEFPGGKIEQGETAEQALNREMLEEIGIEVKSTKLLLQTHHNYPDQSVFLIAFEITEFDGQPQGKEGQTIRWVMSKELTQFQFPDANRVIVETVMTRIQTK